MKGEGTIVLKIEVGDGMVHPIKVKKARYVPEAPSCMLDHYNGHIRQTAIIRILTEHGAPPRPLIVSYTGNRNGTALPSPGIPQ